MAKILVLILVLMVFGLAVPFEKASADDILFNSYVSVGGSGKSTPKSFIAPCKVWVQTTITKAYANGSPRVNPDKTFYPGDGFGYSFTYGIIGSSGCQGPIPKCPIVSNHIFGTPSCGKSSMGNAEITTDYNASDHLIKLQVDAKRWECHLVKTKKSTKWSCGWSIISAVGQFSPNVLKPKIDINLTQEYINDSDGYKSGNLDHTYYIWDAINIVHNPIYPWKNDRVGTLSVKVTKMHDLTLEKEHQCESKSCMYTLVHKGFEPWLKTYEYGSGSTIYNATQKDDTRKHLLTYKVELFNLGQLIHKDENKTWPLVVIYDPIYEKYPYLVLKDEYWWSWGNSQGIALEYRGSNGGGSDDLPGLHENRRSKINRYDASGFALNPIESRKLNQTFSWNSASPIYIDQTKQCQNATTDSSSFEAKKHETAMFVKSGFGKISFDWPIIGTMLQKRYIDATIDNTLQSASFAGFGIKDLTKYRHIYPNVKFNNPIKILTYHSDGSMTNYPISVKMIPDVLRGAEYTQDYVCRKIIHDGYKKEIANIVVDDMYDRKNEENKTGLINMRTLLTSTWFPPFYKIIAEDPLDLNINEGYAALSPFEITITVGEKTRTFNRIVNFLSPFVHVANLDSDNVLNVTESFGFVRIIPDPKFGDILKVTINENELKENCTDGCTTTILANQTLQIEAWNVWGGHASNHLEKFQGIPQKEINWPMAYVAMFVMAIGFMAWKFGSQILEYMGFKSS